MVLTKDELIGALQSEVRLILHLASKVDAANADYRPTAKQRSTLELLQYLTNMCPIHLRAILASSFDMDAFGKAWNNGEAAAKAMSLEEAIASIGTQSALIAELLGPCSDADLCAPMEMFGSTSSRGSKIVGLVLNHYAAYRMQLFLYLKASGREELNTMNLWVGKDMAMPARPK